jgi:UDP-N-acetylglucosamine 2-epimerase (non-hydrolysing)
MKIMTVLGTRPEIIRLSQVIGKLDRLCQHILVHTGQNYDPNLKDIIFDQLKIRKPDYILECKSQTLGGQIGKILLETESVIAKEKPDRLLVLGDTNSALVSVIAKRQGIPVYHMEAGNRCYSDVVPEEVNRRIIDHSSDVLMPYTERSRTNLLREGIEGNRIYVTGNPILEVIRKYEKEISESSILSRLNIESRKYYLVTMHREENVDIESRLRSIIGGLKILEEEYHTPIICSIHPRTKDRMERYGCSVNGKIILYPPFGFFDFVRLEQNALCILSDSGTVQEECCIFQVPNVTLRDVTERPETIECGSNILSGVEPEEIKQCVHAVLNNKSDWIVPQEYLVPNVSDTVAKIVLGYRSKSESTR